MKKIIGTYLILLLIIVSIMPQSFSYATISDNEKASVSDEFLSVKAKTYGKKKIILQWKGFSGAKKYDVFAVKGTKTPKFTSKNRVLKPCKKKKVVISKVSKKSIKPKLKYSFVVRAMDKRGKVISKSEKLVITAGKKGQVVQTKPREDEEKSLEPIKDDTGQGQNQGGTPIVGPSQPPTEESSGSSTTPSCDSENEFLFIAEVNNTTIGYSVGVSNPSNLYYTKISANGTRGSEKKWTGSGVKLNKGEALSVVNKNDFLALSSSEYVTFRISSGKARTEGNYAALGKMRESAYTRAFQDCKNLTSAADFKDVPLAHLCYADMFAGCTSLTKMPNLPSQHLATYCYYNMFGDCSNLVEASALPARELSACCYSYMFYRCTKLKTSPTLSAESLENCCYADMFNGCTALVDAPELPAKTLTSSCYDHMFQGCTSLVIPPDLPATDLDVDCYCGMFYGCTSLKTLPEISAKKFKRNCCRYMFENCSNIKISETQEGSYTIPFCITVNPGDYGIISPLHEMFKGTGGTFTGTPESGKTYYLYNQQ